LASSPAAKPAAVKQASRAAAKAERTADHDLVETVAEQFIARHIRATMRPSWAREAERMVRKEIVGAWKGRKLSEIRKPDIHKLLDEIMDRPAPILANRVLAIFRASVLMGDRAGHYRSVSMRPGQGVGARTVP
jgi:hypothetical protein